MGSPSYSPRRLLPDAMQRQPTRQPPFSEKARDTDTLIERVRLLEAVVDNFPGGISVFDKNLNMVFCNQQQKEMLEYPDELFARGFPSLEDIYRFNALRGEYGPGDAEAQVELRLDLARQLKPHVFERTRPNGTVLEIRGVPLSGGGFVTTYLDVTEQRRNQALIAHMAHHDALTDLPNRLLFRDRLVQALARAQRGDAVALHYLDLDRFKPVNDVLGHAVGDGLLREVASRLLACKRASDTVGRLGGDEFVFIQVSITTEHDAEVFAHRVLDTISAPFEINGHRLTIGASIGVVLAPRDGLEADDLLKKADQALYRAKSSGGGFVFWQ